VLSESGFRAYANWIADARRTARETRLRTGYNKLFNPLMFDIDDYAVRRKSDHVESYNKITGETLFEAHNETEAWQDIREIFGEN